MSRSSILRSTFRRLPPVARRERRIAELQARLAATHEENAHVPSFQGRLFAERRMRRHEHDVGVPSPSVISRGKFWVYDLVRSHGVDVPEQLGRWDDPADIPWDDLPDLVVVKSAFGSTSRGVLPLRRVDDGWQVVTHDSTMTSAQLVAGLTDRVTRGRIRGPFGAEEFLDGDEPGGLPIDLKAYAFYGEVPVIVVFRSGTHGTLDETRYRVVDPAGTDLIDAETNPALAAHTGVEPEAGLARIDLTIPTPEHLDRVVDIAARLSIAMRLPFARIDLYSLRGRVVFGEVTPRPGGRQWLGSELDWRLGDAWERAQARLTRDLAAAPAGIDSPGLPT